MGSPHGQGFGEPIGSSNEKTVGKTPTRGLLADVTTPEAAKTTWIYSFFTDPVYGGFSSNVLADFFVRILLLIATSLGARLCHGRARRRERIARDLEDQRKREKDAALQKFLESCFVRFQGSQGSPGTPPVLQVDSSTAQSSSTAPPPVPENHVQTAGSITAGSIPGSPTSSTTGVPTKQMEAVPNTKRPCEVRQRKLNGIIRSRSMYSSKSPREEHHVIDMPPFPCSCYFPSPMGTKTGDKFKEKAEKLGVAFEQDVYSSRMMQARVPATEANLSVLREVAIEGMKLDEGFTLQIGASFLYCCTGNLEEPVLLSLRDVEVPTILQAEYSAGMLILRGRYLEGVEIRAATSEGYMILASVKQDPIDNEVLPDKRIGTWRCTDLLPPVKLDQIQIFASKGVHIEGQSVTVRSELSPIQDTTLTTLIYNWVPTIIIMSILASQLWTILALLSDLVANPLKPWLSYSTLASMMYTIQLLLPSLEENVNYFIERLKLAISSFHVFPKHLATPTFYMHNGFCFQRGARYLIYPSPPPPTLATEVEDSVEDSDEESVEDSDEDILKITTKGKQSQEQEKENTVTRIDWKWPSSRRSDKTGNWENFDPDSNDHGSNFNDDLPFEVLYDRGYSKLVDMKSAGRSKEYKKCPYLPKETVIKLYSKHLQDVVKECCPNSMKQFESYGEIEAAQLLMAHLNGKLPRGHYDSDSNLSSASASDDEHEKNDLHLFHLTRFLEKEYANTIKEHKRMKGAGIISWDMLWTLLVPGIDVIYYCVISNQELCGKVSSASYRFVTGENGHLSINLEICDFDCNNFVVEKVNRWLRFFKDEMKIINLNVFPLQCKANPQESEESLFQRGRTFSDLVLKHERRFMQYSGLMYDSSRSSTMYDDDGNPYRKSRGQCIKASIDGRVMIDQKWFAKLKSRHDMGTARASEWNPLNEASEMRIKAKANEFDSLLKYSPAIAYGYSFSIRKWGCFNIIGFSEIRFVSTAFDKLVMKEENKLALLTLTEYYINNSQGVNQMATHIDIIPNKGQGCIIVLHGPPGTGKTLTAESLAERLKCPLWQLSVSKLTASTKKLENKVLSTFEVAKSWGAILVLDEADVYLSSRKYSPIGSDNTQNNAMTGVFLRVLEHYKGVLFLTTNVMSHIEPAICSRISLFIKFEEFSTEERRRLWSNFLEESKISNLSEGFWKKVLPAQFNGRVIRNIIQSAQIFIQSKIFGTETAEECVLRAFDAMNTPSTLNYLMVDSHEADQSTPEVAPTPDVAPSMGSAPAPSFTSD